MFLKTKCLRQVALSCINVDNPTITICSILGIFAPWLNQWVTPTPPAPAKKKKTLLHWLTLPAESGDKVYSVSECVYPDFTPWVNVYTLTNDLKATIYPVFCRVLLCGQFGNRNHLQRLLPPLVQFSEFKKKISSIQYDNQTLCGVMQLNKDLSSCPKTSQINSIC